jgi:hypothetical protein
MTNEQIIALACDILGVDPSLSFQLEVKDKIGSLALIHYNENADLNNPAIAYCRGVIISTSHGHVVAHGVPFYPSVTAGRLDHDLSTDEVVIDTDAGEYKFPRSGVMITPFEEPVYLRIFLYENIFYISTTKTIDCVSRNSRWYDFSKPFHTMYSEKGGPTRDDLYSEGARNSPYVYTVGVIDPALNMTCLSFDPQYPEGYIRFDRADKMWDMENSPFTPEEIGNMDQVSVPLTRVSLGVKNLEQMTVEQANDYLRQGLFNKEYSADTRLGYGESVVITVITPDGLTGAKLHIKSRFYSYRETLFNRDPNVYKTFVSQLGKVTRAFASKDFSPENIKAIQPLTTFNPHRKGELPSIQTVTIIPPGNLKGMKMSDIQRMVWINFHVNSSPYYRQMTARMLERFITDTLDLKDWIYDLSNLEVIFLDDSIQLERIKMIIEHSKKRMEKKSSDPNFRYSVEMQRSIDWVIDREDPESLYRLIRLMRQTKRNTSKHITDINRVPMESGITPVPVRLNRIRSKPAPLSTHSFPTLGSAPSSTVQINPLLTGGSVSTPTRTQPQTQSQPQPQQMKAPTTSLTWSQLLNL